MDPAILADIWKIGGASLVAMVLAGLSARAIWSSICSREDRMAKVIDDQTKSLIKQSENCTAALVNSNAVVAENTRVTRELVQVFRERLGESTPPHGHHHTPIPRSPGA